MQDFLLEPHHIGGVDFGANCLFISLAACPRVFVATDITRQQLIKIDICVNEVGSGVTFKLNDDEGEFECLL